MITAREWRWAAIFSALIMIFTALPYLAAASAQTDAWRFGGFLLAVQDGNSYIAKMGQGARGAWLFRLPYSSEPQAGVALYGFYLLLGKLAGPRHEALVLVYHLARILFGFTLLLTSYAFLAEFLPRVGQRRLALLLVALGGGLGWLLALTGSSQLFNSLPVDFISPEAYSFLILFSLPHLALARTLLLLGLLAYLRDRPLLVGLALLGVSLIQPLYTLVAWLVIAAHTLVAPRRAPAGAWRWAPAIRRVTLLGLVSLPGVAYTLFVLTADPLMRQWSAQNILPSPHPLHYLLAFGLLALPAALGWRVLARRRPKLAALAAAWLLLVPVLIYIPIPTQRRLLEGAQLPLVALAVLGLSVRPRRWRRWLVPAVAGLCLPTSLLLWMGALVSARGLADPIFHPADRLAAFSWLTANAAIGDVGLASFETSNALPAFTPLTAYIGHGPETVFLADKQPRVEAFYSAAASDADRRQLLADGRISYVLFGPFERVLGGFDPAGAAYLSLRHSAGDYTVYQVAP